MRNCADKQLSIIHIKTTSSKEFLVINDIYIDNLSKSSQLSYNNNLGKKLPIINNKQLLLAVCGNLSEESLSRFKLPRHSSRLQLK